MTPWEEEELAIFAVCVAGKSAAQTATKVNQLLKRPVGQSPFEHIKSLNSRNILRHALKRVKMGQYDRIVIALRLLTDFELRRMSLLQLESIYGIGPKTARFIWLYMHPNAQVAVLDTHILRWLGLQGHKVPKSTPSLTMYQKLETIFLKECVRLRLTPKELDTRIWQANARKEFEANAITYPAR